MTDRSVTPPAATVRQRLRALAPYFKGTRLAFILSAVGAAVSAACEVGVSHLMQLLVDEGFRKSSVPLWTFPLALIGLFAVRGLAGFVVNYALSWAANQATLKMRHDMFARVLDAHPDLFVRSSSSSLINTVVYEVIAGVTMLVNAVQTVVKDSFTSLGLLGYLLFLNWKLTLLLIAVVPPAALTMRIFSKRMHRITLDSQKATDQLAYVVEENVLAWRIVRLHGAAGAQHGRFEQASQALRRLLLKATVAASTVTPVTQLITACALAGVIAGALWQSVHGDLTAGAFVAFITSAIGVATPLRRLTDVAAPVARGLASVERGMALITQMPTQSAGTHAVARANGDLRLNRVSVRFGDADSAAALDGVDLTICAGESLALVGPSGAGKSTLVNLLPRFIDPTAGELTLDGVPLDQWDLNSLRRQFALVSQDVVLFNDSVAANVALGGTLDRAKVQAALAAANLTAFVDDLPQGIDSPIGHNGAQLSGGQRQRLAIARAIYKDAPVLILDEATSALDSESELLVQQALETLMRGRTSIVIAHRLSTIERADRIVALQAGRVAEHGTHAELLARGGLYARLHALQFGG